MKHILVITATPTHPQNAGNRIRIYKLLSLIREKGFKIHLLYDDREKYDWHVRERPDEASMAACWDAYYRVPFLKLWNKVEWVVGCGIRAVSERLYRVIGGWLLKLKSRSTTIAFHTGLDNWYNFRLDTCIERLKEEFTYDAILVEYAYLSRALLHFKDEPVLKIIDTHDVFTGRKEKWKVFDQIYGWVNFTEKQEKQALERADIIIAIQEQESAFFRRLVNRDVATIGHSVTLHDPQVTPDGRKNILFVGALNGVNHTAVVYFIEKIFPKVKVKVPKARFLIAGHICEIIDPARDVHFLNELPDLDKIYAKADVVVNPTLFGTGLKVKSIEALGYAKPAVFTPVAAIGLEAGENSAFLVGKDADSFAEAVSSILTDDATAQTLARGAAAFAREYNDQQARKLSQLLQRA